MKKPTLMLLFAAIFIFVAGQGAYAQTCGGGITKTSAFPWAPADGMLGTKRNDTNRLTTLLTNCTGKIIFDEDDYNISATLPVFADRVLEGSGSNTVESFPSSKITQWSAVPIFKIGTNVYDVAIRDLGLIGKPQAGGIIPPNLYGILAEGGTTNNCNPGGGDFGNCTSLGFQFSNLRFENLDKGIYVNALNGGEWQFDNVRLDHSRFINCTIGVHINSFNSGWNISSLDFLIPNGAPQGTDGSIAGKTYGIYLQRSTYTSMDLLIGNGPTSNGPPLATALIYIKEHANLSIQNMVAEGFREDIVIDGNTRNYPINLMNNSFLNGVRVKDATVFSSSNMYAAINNNGSKAEASGAAQIYSIGDKFCPEGNTNCDEGRGFKTFENARVIYSSNQGKNFTSVPSFMENYINIKRDIYDTTPNLSIVAPNYAGGPLLRLGRSVFWYDITRDETDGNLNFVGNQAGYGGYTFRTQGGTVKVNYDGSVTYGSVAFTGLGGQPNGTMVYCSNCQKTAVCAAGGTGAMAKKLGGSWSCN